MTVRLKLLPRRLNCCYIGTGMPNSSTTSTQQRLYFVRSPQHSLSAIEAYLIKRGYDVHSEPAPEIALKEIVENQPDYIFVAWDHPDQKVFALADHVARSLNGLVIPYITSAHNTDILRLMQANTQLKLQPPLSGPAIQRFILKYEKARDQFKKTQAQNFKAPTPTMETTEQGTIVLKGHRQNAPVDVIANEKNNPLNKNFDTTVDLTQDTPVTVWNSTKPKSLSAIQKNTLNDLFENQIQNDISDIIETVKELAPENGKPEKSLYALLVESVDCSGFFIFYSDWDIEKYLAEIPLVICAKAITNLSVADDLDEKSIYRSQVFKIDTTNFNDFSFLKKEHGFAKDLVVDDKSTILAFKDLTKNPYSVENQTVKGYVKVDPENFTEGSTINFDVFIELKQNNKIIKYLKVGSQITPEVLEKLIKVQGADFYTSSSSEYDWYEFAINGVLKKMASNNEGDNR